ncbi:hypothetical protein RSEGYP2_37 [Ralstonia phage RsoP1EGY]|uniref:Uncharacterized protein n=1 Tax=Ralstonia phage RsoP1EGY TaxID=2070026 RepID=A0A2R2ZGC3_9CAUD|nr:hypothetical protein HOT00_gp37 [Ralstonia phage RsoP1EGY]AUO78196.1 hypothetical protein RSEGYP2_37 [Ralstonia phage RsoP1EGY]
MSQPSAPPPAPPPPPPPPPPVDPIPVQPAQQTGGAVTSGKSKGRDSLRIDLAQKTSGGGAGLNIPM